MHIDVDVFRSPKICYQIQLQLIDVMGPIIAFVIFLRVTIKSNYYKSTWCVAQPVIRA